MKPILLNDNLISSSAQRGIARYMGKIIDGVTDYFEESAIVCSPQRRNYGLARHIPTLRFPGSWRIGLQDKFASVAATFIRPSVVYNVYYGHVHTKALQTFTVYDMMHELFAPPNHPFIAQKRACLQRAAALFAISESTAKDITAIYPDIDTSKIIVTQLGVDEFFFQIDDHLTGTQPSKPYFLYVGHRTPYKNFMRLLTAYGQSGLAKNFDIKVISPGGSRFTETEIECINTYHLQKCIRLIISPSDSELRTHYAGAFAFIYPSIYEGFGLPLLEAMASGTLVATSNISSMPELGGEVAFYFDPNSTESITDCLLKLASLSEEQRAWRISQGISRARTFTWERCLAKTMNLLRHLTQTG